MDGGVQWLLVTQDDSETRKRDTRHGWGRGGGGPLDWGIFLPWLSLILSRLSHYYSFEYVISRSDHSTNLDFHFSFYQKPTFGIWGFLNYFGNGDTLFAMSLKPLAETIALTKKQCLESATNVLFLLSDAITVKYCLCQWQIIAPRAALFYFISRPPLPILLHFLPDSSALSGLDWVGYHRPPFGFAWAVVCGLNFVENSMTWILCEGRF